MLHRLLELALQLLLIKTYYSQTSARLSHCLETRCTNHGPSIRYPFSLNTQPQNCGLLGFPQLTCSKDMRHTILQLPVQEKLIVKQIMYNSQLIKVSPPDGCLLRLLTNLNLSSSKFHFQQNPTSSLTVFNCSSSNNVLPSDFVIPCLGVQGYTVYALNSTLHLEFVTLSSCTKLYDISSIPSNLLYKDDDLLLSWSENKSIETSENSGEIHNRALEIAGPIIIFVVVLIFLVIHWCRTKKIDQENEARIEKFLEDYRALNPTRYSYADIKKITNHFKNELGKGAYGTVYKGKLFNDISVAVKVLNGSTGNGEEFINEMGTMGRVHHVNVVRLVGFCADGVKRGLVYEYLPNGSLQKFISSADIKKRVLGWEKLEEIALGIAKGIEYLHQGCDQRILHFDIKPHNILLDQNFTPKISDFGLAKLCSKDQSAVSMTAARGTVGYIAPEVFSRNFGNVSYKSDVYSFGMLLLDMVGGRKHVADGKSANSGLGSYFPEWIYNLLEKRDELRIHIEVEKDAKIAKKLAIVGLWCIQWHPVDRPSMQVVVHMLEGEVDNLAMPPNPFASADPTILNANVLGRHLFNE